MITRAHRLRIRIFTTITIILYFSHQCLPTNVILTITLHYYFLPEFRNTNFQTIFPHLYENEKQSSNSNIQHKIYRYILVSRYILYRTQTIIIRNDI